MSIGLTLAAGTAFTAGAGTTLAARTVLTPAGVIAAAITFAAGTTLAAGSGTTLAARSVLTSTGVIAAAIVFTARSRAAFATSGAARTGTTLATRSVLTSTGVITATIVFAARSRAAFATSGAAGTGTAFAAAMVAVMPAMMIEGRSVRGGQGGEFRCVEHAVAVLVVLGEQIGGGVGLIVAFSFGRALRMGGGGQREAAEEDRECFVHVTCGLGVYGGLGVSRLPSQDKRRPERHRP